MFLLVLHVEHKTLERSKYTIRNLSELYLRQFKEKL